MKERGVIYYNTGTSCAVRLLVSLASLRRHYPGPVTILSEGAESDALCGRIGDALGAEVRAWQSGVAPGPNRPFLAKTRMHKGTPYETTVALDSDTLVLGPVDDLFPLAEAHTFCVAQFSNWTTGKRTIRRRLLQWEQTFSDWIEPAILFGPAINTGVLAFRKDASIFTDWHRNAEMGREFFIPDEICCQLMLPRHPHYILDPRWNRSCKHDDPGKLDTRIIHYHGRKHCRPRLPYHADRWTAAFDEVRGRDLAGVSGWLPAGDRQLRRHLSAARRQGKAEMPGTSPADRPVPVYETPLWCRRGHFNRDQADKFAELCESARPRTALETGFCTGRSAACILHYGGTGLKRMISVDINLDYKAPHGRRMATLLKSTFPHWDVIEKSSRLVLTGEFFAREFPEGVDFASIDGDHSFEGCTHDLEAIAPRLNRNGIMVVDDYRSGGPKGVRVNQVTRSVDDFLVRHLGTLRGEQWHCEGKGFCLIRHLPRL